MSRLLDVLRSGRVLLMDGAMGTELQRLGPDDPERFEVWNLDHPDRVSAVHRGYAAAGAVVHLTNSFQMYSGSFSGEARRLREACLAAARLARAAAGEAGFVLGSLGPPFGPLAREFHDLAGVTVAAYWVRPADGILIETCSTPRARFAVDRAQQ